MTELDLKAAPDVKRVVLAALPGYRKYNAYLKVFPSCGVGINSYWDGRSKEEFAVVDMATGRTKLLPSASHPYYDIARQGMAGAKNAIVAVDHVRNVTLNVLPEGYALVRAGTFCGKPAMAYVVVPAVNMARLLAAT
jgi:hypothetical protein